VALIHGPDRYSNIGRALQSIAGDMDLSGRQRVLIKPNFVLTHKPEASTHVNAVRAVLDFLRDRHQGPIVIAEGPALQPAAEGFRRYGYESLAQEYGVELRDLNNDPAVPVTVYDWRLQPLRLHLARTVLDSDFRISVGPPKTHDAVIVTLSLKNMIMGSLISRFTHGPSKGNGQEDESSPGRRLDLGRVTKRLWRLVPDWFRDLPPTEWLGFRAMSLFEPSDKMKMHQSYPIINLNLALLAPLVKPHLAVIDGFEAMEGNGPTEGTLVPLGLALASVDALAADVVGTTIMGFDPEEVGYLHYCRRMQWGAGNLSQIEIVGNVGLASCIRPFRPHASYRRQQRWHLPNAERYLARQDNGPKRQSLLAAKEEGSP
jgi:uncharacterized protein (DUF362 family)